MSISFSFIYGKMQAVGNCKLRSTNLEIESLSFLCMSIPINTLANRHVNVIRKM